MKAESQALMAPMVMVLALTVTMFFASRLQWAAAMIFGAGLGLVALWIQSSAVLQERMEKHESHHPPFTVGKRPIRRQRH